MHQYLLHRFMITVPAVLGISVGLFSIPTLVQRPQAKSLELWGSMSLSRLWQQGKRAEACTLVAEIYG